MIEINALNKLVSYLECEKICYYQDYDISSEFWSKTGSKVDFFIIPGSSISLVSLIKFIRSIGLEYKIFGGGTNTLFLDSVQYSIFISSKLLTKITFHDNYVDVQSGKLTSDFVREVVKRGYTGFEGLEGIPGSIGGALFMNAGAYGYTVSQNLLSVTVLEYSGEVREYSKQELVFFDRNSSFKNNAFSVAIVSMRFYLNFGEYDDIERKVSLYHVLRNKSLEYTYPNLGSIFALPRSDVYRKTKHPFFSSFLFKIFCRFYYSRLATYLKTKKDPDNEIFNKMFFFFHPNIKILGCHSRKTLNTFVNKDFSTLEIIKYINEVGKALDDNVEVENELVLGPISKVTNYSDYFDSLKLWKEIDKESK